MKRKIFKSGDEYEAWEDTLGNPRKEYERLADISWRGVTNE